jgi:hypothetical protein
MVILATALSFPKIQKTIWTTCPTPVEIKDVTFYKKVDKKYFQL